MDSNERNQNWLRLQAFYAMNQLSDQENSFFSPPIEEFLSQKLNLCLPRLSMDQLLSMDQSLQKPYVPVKRGFRLHYFKIPPSLLEHGNESELLISTLLAVLGYRDECLALMEKFKNHVGLLSQKEQKESLDCLERNLFTPSSLLSTIRFMEPLVDNPISRIAGHISIKYPNSEKALEEFIKVVSQDIDKAINSVNMQDAGIIKQCLKIIQKNIATQWYTIDLNTPERRAYFVPVRGVDPNFLRQVWDAACAVYLTFTGNQPELDFEPEQQIIHVFPALDAMWKGCLPSQYRVECRDLAALILDQYHTQYNNIQKSQGNHKDR